jgi:hypothetical protein
LEENHFKNAIKKKSQYFKYMSIYTILPKMRDSLNPWKREKDLGFMGEEGERV